MLEVAEDGTTLVAHIQEMIVVTAIERTVEGLAEGKIAIKHFLQCFKMCVCAVMPAHSQTPQLKKYKF